MMEWERQEIRDALHRIRETERQQSDPPEDLFNTKKKSTMTGRFRNGG